MNEEENERYSEKADVEFAVAEVCLVDHDSEGTHYCDACGREWLRAHTCGRLEREQYNTRLLAELVEQITGINDELTRMNDRADGLDP